MKELLARIRAMTRRQTDTTDNVLAFGDIALNRSTYQLTGPENPEGIRLAGKEYQMLEMLMSNTGQVKIKAARGLGYSLEKDNA